MEVMFERDQLVPVPPPPSTDSLAPSQSTRTYFDCQRRAYDIGYHEIEPVEVSGNPTPETSLAGRCKISDLVFPSPVGFSSKEAYFQAVKNWKQRVEALFDAGQLPVPISSMYYRPEPPSVFNPGDEAARRFKPELSPCVPVNFNKMLEILLAGSEINPDEEFPFQIQHRKVVTMRNQITGEKQWQSELAPPEPNPAYYDTFDRYLSAYKLWSTAAKATVGIRMPNPKEFGPRLHLNPAAETMSGGKTSKAVEQKQEGRSLSWVDSIRVKEVQHEDKILSFMQERQKLWLACTPLQCLVFGVDQCKFVTEFKEVGVYQETLHSDRPVHPFAFLELRSQGSDASEAIASVVTDKSLSEMQVIFQLMKIDFQSSEFDTAMNMWKRVRKRRASNASDAVLPGLQSMHPMTPNHGLLNMPILKERRLSDGESMAPIADSSDTECESDQEHLDFDEKPAKIRHGTTMMGRAKQGRQHKGTKVLRYLKKRLKPCHIMKSLFIGQHSPDLRAKMSILLRTLVNTDFGITLFDELLQPANVKSLYETVGVLLALANFHVTLIAPSTENDFALKLSQFHLLSSLIQDKEAVWFRPFRGYILGKCRSYSLKLSSMVYGKPEIRNELWESLTAAEQNDKANLMQMMAVSSVLNMNRIILGEDFIQRANEVSKYKMGRRFLLRFIYNDNAFNTTMLFVRKPISPDETYTDYFVTILGYMMSQLLRHLKSHHLVYDTSVLLPLFKESELSSRLSLLVPVARICCLNDIAQRARQTAYQTKLSDLCKQIIDASIDKIGKLKLLLPFADVSVCAEAMCRAEPFLESLTRGIYSTTMQEFLLTWLLLRKICKCDSATISLMKTAAFTHSFHRLQDGRADAVENMLEFLLSLWDSPNSEVRDAAAQGMLSSVGIIACIPNLASQRFDNRTVTKQIVEKFIARTVTSTEGSTPSQVTFANQLKTHLMSNGVESRKGTVLLRNRPLLEDLQ